MASVYFAADESNKTAGVVLERVSAWCNSWTSSGFIEKLRSLYCCYHGAYYTDAGNGHQITFSGEQGELVNLPVNHFRNIAQHILNMTCSNRPVMECRSTNTDYKSQIQTVLANSILEYYMREKKLEEYIRQAVEHAIVYGTGFIRMEWDATKGEVVDYIEDTQTEIHEGDLTFNVLSVFDVVYDGTKENANDNEWVAIRTWKNKYDLAAKYPEFATKLIETETKDDINNFKVGISNILDKTDDIQVIEFYHQKSNALPNGRYMMFVDSDIILQDVPMPYRILPVFRISAGDIHGSPYGYTAMMDLVPLQEAVNTLHSTILTNQNAFGVQNILLGDGADISSNQLVGSLNVIKWSGQPGMEPKALQLCKTPEEVFKYVEILEHTMETLSGVNSVSRGNPEASLKSGTALALVQSMSLQFMSGLQQNYVNLVEHIGTALIKILQDFANTPRLVAIAGKSNRTYMKEFTGEDISNISRVTVDVGNPMARTTAGRVQMASELIQYGEITPAQYVTLIHTGNLEQLTESTVHENLLMRSENEVLMDGKEPLVTPIDNHKEHIDYHKSILFDPTLREDAQLVQRVLSHIQKHIDSLREVDPDLLMLLGQQPLPPMPSPGMPPSGQGAGPPPPPGAPGPGGPPPNDAGEMAPPQQGQMGPGVNGGKVTGPGLPSGGQRIAGLPSVKAGLLPNPALQQQSLNNVKMK